MDEGRLLVICERIKAGDFLFIQFGHNDEKPEEPTRYAAPEMEFPINLGKFVNVARNKGAIPVFITSLTRWDRNNPNAKYRHDEWAARYRRTADKLGDIARMDFYMNLPAGVYPAYPDDLKDGTLRLHAVQQPDNSGLLWHCANVLTKKIDSPASAFTTEVQLVCRSANLFSLQAIPGWAFA